MISSFLNLNNPEPLTLFKDSTNPCDIFISIAENFNLFDRGRCSRLESISNHGVDDLDRQEYLIKAYGKEIEKEHWEEWCKESGISPFVTIPNLESEASNPLTPLYDRIFISEEIPRRNPGQVTTGYFKRYQHLEKGGWASFGVNVLSPIGEESEWGVVKPDCPRISQEGKTIKYEVPPKVATEIFAPHVSFLVSWHLVRSCSNAAKQAWAERLLKTADCQNLTENSLAVIETAVEQIYQQIWDIEGTLAEALGTSEASRHSALGTRNNITSDGSDPTDNENSDTKRASSYGLVPNEIPSILLSEDKGFYQYVISDPTIPIVITEGNKKAAKLITEGFVTLSVPGVFNGYRKETDKLIPQLEVFAVVSREIVIGFDQDNKERTIANVNKAIAKTGKLFEREGCKVSVLTWDYPEKGVDDLIVAHGSEVFESIKKRNS